MGDAVALYAVVSSEGKLRHRKRAQGAAPMIYDTLGAAQRQCRAEGDSVVELYLNLDREPLFIRSKRVDGAR
jgi:hypothetical protein